MFTARADRPYFTAWLRRTRKQFAVSGRLAQTALLLSKEKDGTAEEWEVYLRNLLDSGEIPSLEILTRIDTLLSSAQSGSSSVSASDQGSFW